MVATPGFPASICDVTSGSVSLTLRSAIANSYIHIDGREPGVLGFDSSNPNPDHPYPSKCLLKIKVK